MDAALQSHLEELALRRVLLDLLDYHAELSHAMLTNSNLVIAPPDSVLDFLERTGTADPRRELPSDLQADQSTEQELRPDDIAARLTQADYALQSIVPFLPVYFSAHDSLTMQIDRVQTLASSFSKVLTDLNNYNDELGSMVRNAKLQVQASRRAMKRPLNVEHLLDLGNVVGHQTGKSWGGRGQGSRAKKSKVEDGEGHGMEGNSEPVGGSRGPDEQEARTAGAQPSPQDQTKPQHRDISRSPTPTPQQFAQLEAHLPYPSEAQLRSGSLGSKLPSWKAFLRQKRREEDEKHGEGVQPKEEPNNASADEQLESFAWRAAQRERNRADEDAFQLDL